MSRSSHPRHQMQLSQQQISENDGAAQVAELFDHFCVATTMRQILGIYRGMCDAAGLRAGPLNDFYPKLKAKIRNWKAQALWKKFDARAAHRVYCKGNAGAGSRVLVIGAGPCGLRTAIEAQLLGAKVVVVEKRDRISRNNVLHLWPFLITDLRNLGAKKFYGKFCAGSIDHISIRQLQCILLKVALLLGVEVHEGVSFIKTVEPSDGCGWRAHVSPEDHAVSHYEFDVLIGADGKRNTLEGFKRKEFRGKLAIAITANFINKKTEAEAKAEEISGVAFIFNQSFFKELYQTTGIDLENVVYYKDETHYFVMTAKKHSLLDKGVIIQDFADPAELLAPLNVNTDKLLDYAREAAEFSTKYQMPNLEFAVNHYGKPDVAMFDFTSMFAAEASCRAIVKKNYRLLQCLVGDSLLEPFWPTGSGCARGFLSSMDAAYAIKLWSNNKNSILGVLAQRESIYRLLAQTTPENLQRDIGAYTVDPATRYPNLNKSTVNVWQVKHLLETDDPALLEQTFIDMTSISQSGADTPIRRKRRTGDTLPLSTVLLRWIKAQLHACNFVQDLTDLSECFTKGQVLCALINRYRPDLVDLKDLPKSSPKECNELAFKILEVELGIPRALTAKDSMNLENIDSKIWLNYLEQVCEVFRGEIPHIKYFKLDFDEFKAKTASNNAPDFSRLLKQNSNKAKPPMQEADPGNLVTQRRSVLDDEKAKKLRKYGADNNSSAAETARRPKKRRSHEKSGNIEERQQRLKEIESNRLDRQNKRRLHRFQQTQNFYKSLTMLQVNTLLRESDSSSPFEDYSIYMYRQQAPEFNDRVKELERKLLHPDRERGLASSMPRSNTDEHFNDRIKHMEQRITSRRPGGPEKKPKDLLRAIGKIESTDWNIREIEKKIEQSKKTELQKSKEKVPRWSKEQFLARQNKMAKPLDKDEVTEEKFKTIDQTLKNLDKQLKEGSLLEVGERGKNKVASIAGQLSKKADISDEKPAPDQKKTNPKAGMVFTKQAVSEKCHFCKQTVYLMEKISTEGLILHRSCLKCHHCHTNLRLGGYAFDRDDPEGRFYCTQHFRLPAKAVRPVSTKRAKLQKQSDEKERQKQAAQKSAEQSRTRPENVAQLDLLDRGQTPERIEFENVDALSDGEPSLENIIDENEWTDRNFPSEGESSNNSSSDSSDEDSDSDMFEEANGSPLGAQTLQLATDWIGKQRYNAIDDSDDEDFYDSSEGLLDDETDSQTEGEEFKKAREMRRQEVKVKPPLTYLLTDTDTEVHTVTESSPSDEVEWNSATEISTDSEFDHDPIIRETPSIFIDDTHIRKPTKVQVRQGIIANNAAQKLTDRNNENIRKKQEVEFKPLIQVDPLLLNSRMPLKNPRPGDYLLNKAPSTEGIASKKSLELKKRYLLGEQGMGNGIMKSGSTSILDSKLKSFHSNISECQKLLNPGSDISPTMKTFLNRTKIGSTILSASGSMEDVDQKQPSDIEITRDNEYCETIRSLKEFTEKPPTNLQTIDLVSPEKELPIIDLTSHEIPLTLAEIEQKLSESIKSEEKSYESIIDLTKDTPEKKSSSKEQSSPVNVKPDISKDLKEPIPDVISQIVNGLIHENTSNCQSSVKESSNTFDVYSSEKESEKNDQEALLQDNDVYETSIKVPNIQWDQKNENDNTDSLSNSSSSSLDDIPHFILESTTSPDTQNGPEQIVPQVHVHDTSGTLMQIDSLMIIDGKYVGDPEDLRHMEIPRGTNLDISETVEVTENLITQSDKPDLKFDTKNENKIDTLKHLPMILEKDNAVKVTKPNKLDLDLAKHKYEAGSDTDRTPTLEKGISDSETEVTGQVLTETELSDWAADDCVSENFVDIEFALNSNKGTIRRNKKGKKKLPQCEEQLLESISKPMGSQKECSILTNLDIEEIEFMDTGSEGSCIEAYCATNKALLQNRGYIEFVDQNHPSVNESSYRNYELSLREINIPDAYKRVHEATNKEIPGIDYIEQGACILSSDMDAKTPVNEPPSIYNSKSKNSHSSNASSQQTDSLNDIDEDSLVQINSHDAITTTNTTTTEESDALTIVTSPADVFSVKVKDLASTPSSSDKNEKTVECQESTILVRKSSPEESRKRSIHEDSHTSLGGKRKDSEECSYEEYVRKLQMKITQISNARDSIDIRKQKRKNSKGDISHDLTQSSPVIEKNLSIFEPSKSLSTNNNNSKTTVEMQTQQEQSHLSKLVDSPPISRKLEEITKERTKQKDLIHDLVMNKLQSKKQLNAEKRLNRSRNRSLFSPNGYSIIPELQTSECANSPHYHVASSVERPIIKPLPLELSTMTSLKLSISPIKPKIRAAMFTNQQEQRPFSVNLDDNTLISPTSKISNIKSFCSYTTSDLLKQSTSEPKPNSYVSPVPPPRTSKKTEDGLKAEMIHKEFHRSNPDIFLRAEERDNWMLCNILNSSNQGLGLEIYDKDTDKNFVLKSAKSRTSPKETKNVIQLFASHIRPKERPLSMNLEGINPTLMSPKLAKTQSFCFNKIYEHSKQGTHTNESNSRNICSTPMPPPRTNKKAENLSENKENKVKSITRASHLSNPELNRNLEEKSLLFEKLIYGANTLFGLASQKHMKPHTSTLISSNSCHNIASNKSHNVSCATSDLNSPEAREQNSIQNDLEELKNDLSKRRKSLRKTVSNFFQKKKDKETPSPTKEKTDSGFSRFRISPKSKNKSKDKDAGKSIDHKKSQDCLKCEISSFSSSPQLFKRSGDVTPPPIPPLPLNYQRSDDESFTTESREHKKQRAISKASRQAELKRLRIAQEIQREQEEIEVKLKELEARGVLIEKALRGEGQNVENLEASSIGASDEKLLKELLEIWRNITQLKKRDEELGIRQKELQLEHRHAQLKEELNTRLSCSKLDKSSADVAAEGAILNEMLEIVAKRAALRSDESTVVQQPNENDPDRIIYKVTSV